MSTCPIKDDDMYPFRNLMLILTGFFSSPSSPPFTAPWSKAFHSRLSGLRSLGAKLKSLTPAFCNLAHESPESGDLGEKVCGDGDMQHTFSNLPHSDHDQKKNKSIRDSGLTGYAL
ncbi:hypothetical protein AMATHDRAFT_46695 [Amanita thiersii Skay4041]|uniref:Uncharacterized protein n=1 Tax=Amanita thiersii Skay4041 TaxID=703135 RepID=A0A2A9NVZ1_9AGAR|nr:hypothetical protein AMATHDRAFT_46695 [Amanita thiersii Skay4041]